MVSPERKRQAVLRFQERLSVSERRACRLIAQPRATRRYRGVRLDQDAPLVAALRRVSTSRPRAGYRMAAAYLRREGWTLNDKGAQRFWRQEGIKVPRRQRKLRRLGSSENSAQRLRATRVNEVWSYDFVFDQTEEGRRLKWLPICDFVQPGEHGVGSRTPHGERRRDSHPGRSRRRARDGAGVHPQRQRPGVHRGGRAGMDPRARVQDALHRAWQPVGEPLQRELQAAAFGTSS